MQVSYSITGEDGHHAAAQLETRVRHDTQDASPATVKLLNSITGYVRDAVGATSEAVDVEVDVTIRVRKHSAIAPAHLAPSPSARGGVSATTADSGLESVPTGAEGSEIGADSIAGVVRTLSIVTDEQLREIEAAENAALARARAEMAATANTAGQGGAS